MGFLDLADPVPLSDGIEYRGFFRTATGDYELPEILRRRIKSASSVQRVAQTALLKLTVPPIKANKYNIFTDRYGYEVTVDPSRGFFPTVIQVNSLKKNGSVVSQRETVVLEFVATSAGIHVPSKVVTRGSRERPSHWLSHRAPPSSAGNWFSAFSPSWPWLVSR